MTVLLGDIGVGGTPGGHYLGSQAWSRFQCGTTGTVNTLYAYIGDPKRTFLRIAIFSDNSGAIGDVLAQGVVTVTAINTWHSLTGLSVSVTSGTFYWLAVCMDGLWACDADAAVDHKNTVSTGNVAFVDDPAFTHYYHYSISTYADGIVPVSIEVSAVAMTATATAPTPAVVGGTDIAVSAVTAAVTAATGVPTVTAQVYLTISGALATAAAEAFAPSIALYADAEVQTVNIDARAMDPYIHGGAVVSAEASAAAAAAAAPTAEGGSGVAPYTLVADATIPTPQVYTTQAKSEVSLVGERLEVFHDPAITTTTVAGYVAIAVLVKARLDGKKATITIPPICNLELWDVLSAYDDPAAQDSNYRVCGYTFEYDTRRAAYRHTLDLCAP